MMAYYWCRVPLPNLPNHYTLYYVVHDGASFAQYAFNGEAISTHGGGPWTTKAEVERALGAPLRDATLQPGQFYKRMWRGQRFVAAEQFGTEGVERDAVRFARMLADSLRTIFRYVEPSPAHDDVYSHELRALHILACTEVENACKAILTQNQTQPARPPPPPGTPPLSKPPKKKQNFDMNDYSRVADAMRLPEYGVLLSTRPDYGNIKPFDGWTTGGLLSWYTAYNKTKHDRDGALDKATLGNVVRATAAVYVLNIAQFGNYLRDAVYFSPDEFVLGATPKWAREDKYVPPVAHKPLQKPPVAVPPGHAWSGVNYPF